MKQYDPIKDVTDRFAIVSMWQYKLDRLSSRKVDPLSNGAFCRKYDLDLPWLSKTKKIQPLPRWKKIKQVEKAFESEGII